MSTPDLNATASAADPGAVYPPVERRPSVVLAIVAVVTGGALTLLYLMVKIVAPWINPDYGSDTSNAISTVFGVLGLLAIIPAGGVVVMGHLALRRRADGTSPGRAIAGVALGFGYVQVLMWGNRILIAAIVAAQSGDFSTFVSDTFWWA